MSKIFFFKMKNWKNIKFKLWNNFLTLNKKKKS